MPLTRVFAYEEHPEYGVFGLRPVDMPGAAAYGAGAVAHDLLEHSPDDDGSALAEFRALGAAAWIRGLGGYWEHPEHVGNRSIDANLTIDWLSIADAVDYEGAETGALDLPTVHPRIERAFARLGAGWVDELFSKVTEDGAAMILRERASDGPLDRESFAHFLTTITGQTWAYRHLVRGFLAARRRYARYAPEYLAYVFRETEKTVDRWLIEAADDGTPEGQRVRVTVNLRRRGETSITLVR